MRKHRVPAMEEISHKYKRTRMRRTLEVSGPTSFLLIPRGIGEEKELRYANASLERSPPKVKRSAHESEHPHMRETYCRNSNGMKRMCVKTQAPYSIPIALESDTSHLERGVRSEK